MYDVITVGSAIVDAYAKTEFSKIIKRRGRGALIAYPCGSKILVQDLILSVGGGGTNSAVALSRLGHKVAFLGKLGAKGNALRVMSDLKKEKVDTSLVIQSKRGRTGYSIILDSKGHDRTILVFRGSNNDLNYNEIRIKKMRTRWFYFSAMMGKSFKTLEKLSEHAARNNIKIVFVLSSYLAEKGVRYLRDIIKTAYILVLNKEEACVLVGNCTTKNLLKRLQKLGPEIIAITDGIKGVNILHNNYLYYGKSHKIKIVETTGAGDAFASSFLSGIIRKNDVEFAMKLGMTNAESVIQHHGTKSKLLSYREALGIMNKKPIRVTKSKLF